jgi:Ca-activated chloride channel family protein
MVIGMALVCAWTPAAGQEELSKQNKPPVGLVKVETVILAVTVLDKNGNPVNGLRPEAFHVKEDGAYQKVALAEHEDTPVSVGLVLDRSGSMLAITRAVNDAALQFIKTTSARDEFFLVDFDEHVELVSDADSLKARLNDPTSKGRTALLDAVYFGISQMRNAHNAKKILLVVTDGMDNDSRYSNADVRNILKETDVQVYMAVITQQDGLAGYQATPLGLVDIKEFCNLSGGQVFTFGSLQLLPGVLKRISAIVRSQYAIRYYPSNMKRDGKWHSVKVKVDVPPGLRPARVFTRSGYYGPPPVH